MEFIAFGVMNEAVRRMCSTEKKKQVNLNSKWFLFCYEKWSVQMLSLMT